MQFPEVPRLLATGDAEKHGGEDCRGQEQRFATTVRCPGV